MRNENNELMINTAEAMMVLRVINKLNMKDELVKAIGEFTKIQQETQQEYKKLRELIINASGGSEKYSILSDDDKETISNKILLLEDNGIQTKLVALEEKQNSLGVDILYNFISKLPLAEKEVYKALATIFNKNVKEVETQELNDTIEMIKEIVKCKSLIGFFK